MRLAVIGSGMIVSDLLSVAADIPGMELGAICGRERSLPRLNELAADHGIAKVHTDYEQCLADAGVDTVYIGLPNSMHAQYARQALLAGKHVICEKPFTLKVAELEELQALAHARELVLVEAISNQYLSNYRAIKQRLGELGDLKLVTCEYSQFSSRYDAFRAGTVLPAFDPAMGGGALMDLGIYPLHFVAGLLGRPNSITYTANIDRGVDTSGVIVMAYDTLSAVCVCAKDSGGENRTKIQGTEGTIIMAGAPNVCEGFAIELRGGARQEIDLNVHPHRMVEEFRAFVEMVDTRDLAERDRRLDHSLLVLDLATQALDSAGIRLGA